MADPRGDITKYLGVEYAFAPTYVRDRAPTVDDVQDEQGIYKIPSFWVHIIDPDGDLFDVYTLVDINSSTGSVEATWLLTAGGPGGTVTSLEADDGNVANPTGGTIDVLGEIVANATNAKPLFTTAAVDTVTAELQISTTVPAGTGTINDVGLVSLNEDHFSINSATGEVSLVGSSSDMNTLTADTATAPGVNPIVPDGTGNIDVFGSLVDAHSVPIETHTRAVNTLTVEPQIAASNATSDRTANGMIHVDSAAFDIDTDGFLQLAGGGGTATTSILTDSGAPAVEPDATGQIDILGGVGIDTAGTGPGNTVTINADGDVATQYNTDSGSATPSGNLLNVNGSGGVTTSASGNTITITGSGGGFTCDQVTADVNPMVANTKYVVNSATPVTLTLPTTTAVCDDFIVIRKGTGDVTIAQSAGQQVHLNGVSTTAGAAGSAESTAQWDTIWLSTVTTDLEFVQLNASGTWTAN